MKRFLGLFLAMCLVVGFAGCEKKDEVKKQTKVTTPEGTTTTTTDTKVEKSGDNPPPARNP
jgi:hypothetical protein